MVLAAESKGDKLGSLNRIMTESQWACGTIGMGASGKRMKSVQQATPRCVIVYSNLFLLLAKAGVWATLAFVDHGR
jgi:hypothetical protein